MGIENEINLLIHTTACRSFSNKTNALYPSAHTDRVAPIIARGILGIQVPTSLPKEKYQLLLRDNDMPIKRTIPTIKHNCEVLGR